MGCSSVEVEERRAAGPCSGPRLDRRHAGGQLVAEGALDLDGPAHRGARHHPVEVAPEAGELSRRRSQELAEAPEQPEQVDLVVVLVELELLLLKSTIDAR